MMRFLSDDERAQLQHWVFSQTDGEVISDPEYKVVERIVRAHRFQAWDRAHTTICTEVPCRRHRNPYVFVRATRGPLDEFVESTADGGGEEYRGRSLYWLRKVLGLPARYSTAAIAAENSGPLNTTVPPSGAVAWFSSPPYGNCALTLGGNMVLALNRAGMPVVRVLNDQSLGTYIGWSKTIGTIGSTNDTETEKT